MKVVVVSIMLSLLTACGTVSGFGNDISGAANWTKEKMGGK
jgi:predicted small secreted protein